MCVIIVYLQCKALRTPTALQQRKTAKVELAFVCFIATISNFTARYDIIYTILSVVDEQCFFSVSSY